MSLVIKNNNMTRGSQGFVELAQITNPSLRERMERGLVGSMIKTKANLGLGLKNEKKSKWTDQLAEELHKPVTRKFLRRKVYVSAIDKIWAADLVDMQAFSKYNKGVKYLLTVVVIFSPNTDG